MSKKSGHHTTRVVLKLPYKVADFIIRAQGIHDAMAANSGTLPKPSPALPVLQAHIDDLITKQAAAKTRVAGAVEDRDAVLKLVALDLGSERGYVEQLVNADPGNGDVIAQDAAMTLRKVPSVNKSALAAKPGPASGMVHVVAKAVKGARANDWQYSVDGGKTWIDVVPTTRADRMF